MTDPIADFLTRIRNAIISRKQKVDVPASKLKKHIAELLRDEGFLSAVAEQAGDSKHGGQGTLVLTLRYDNRNRCAIEGLRRVSRPGQRTYVNKDSLPKVRSGLGISVVTTSRGVMTDRAARKAGLGGELICEVW
jgi:small subunit ribosomal protein S8